MCAGLTQVVVVFLLPLLDESFGFCDCGEKMKPSPIISQTDAALESLVSLVFIGLRGQYFFFYFLLLFFSLLPDVGQKLRLAKLIRS